MFEAFFPVIHNIIDKHLTCVLVHLFVILPYFFWLLPDECISAKDWEGGGAGETPPNPPVVTPLRIEHFV